jgi:hypothetical protein
LRHLGIHQGLNPRYVKGFCADPAINLSGNTILTSESCGDAIGCRDAFPFSDYFDDIDMTDSDPISKIYTWEMFGPGFGDDLSAFAEDDINESTTNLNDTSWANPYDMAKGHRGFMTGDMIMAMYAWTPNWNDLTNAHSIVNLYVRRSFDGGLTWSTTPASFTHTNGIAYSGNGTTTCENMGPISEQVPVCVTYTAGQFEQARNVSQLLGSQVTVLDPRYSPTSRTITATSVSTLLPVGFIPPDGEDLDAVRDPSRFFMVYETGHASAYDAGEATPLDLFYSRDGFECLPAIGGRHRTGRILQRVRRARGIPRFRIRRGFGHGQPGRPVLLLRLEPGRLRPRRIRRGIRRLVPARAVPGRLHTD